MSEHEPIEGELVPYQPHAPANIFGASDPSAVIERASEVATTLRGVLQKQHLTHRIGNKDHVLVEGWTLLGSMLGVFPICVWTRPLGPDGSRPQGWEARVEARTRSGEIVGAAEAECTRDERRWSSADDYAIRSMAQTRATSKALRLPLGFVVTLAGFEATPAEERDGDGPSKPPPAQTKRIEPITSAQLTKIGVLVKEVTDEVRVADGAKPWIEQLRERYGVKSRKQLTKAQATECIDWLEKVKADEGIPFG